MSVTNNPLVNYVRESREELSKVSWPSRKVVIRDTAVVIAACVATAIFFAATDFGLSTGLDALLTRVQLLQ